jgi:hypothetical protein
MLVLLGAGKLVVDGLPRRPDEIDAVVFTDPGHEWSFTYDLIPRVEAYCRRFGLRFLWQKKPPAEGPDGWIAWMAHQVRAREQARAVGRASATFGDPPWRREPPVTIEARAASGYYHQRIPLFEDYGAKDAWISKDDSSCTIIHKIVPNREMLVDLQIERFGRLPERPGTKRRSEMARQGEAWGDAVRAGQARPHLMLIGYAADETTRLSEVKEKPAGKTVPWNQDVDTEAYPLMEMGIDKGDEQAVLERELGVDSHGRFVAGGFDDVKKSGCRSCKEQDVAQFWMLRTLDPAYFAQIEDHERRVVARTGPWQAIFPKKLVAVLARRPDEINPAVVAYQQEGLFVLLAYQAELTDGKAWVPVGPTRAPKLAAKGYKVVAHVWIPLGPAVDRWLAAFQARHGRDPDVEEVARKEYRGCSLQSA